MKTLKRCLSIVLTVAIVLSAFFINPGNLLTANKAEAAAAGKYDVRIRINITEHEGNVKGGTNLTLRLAGNNGTASAYNNTVNSEGDSLWNTGGRTLYVYNTDFPVSINHHLRMGGDRHSHRLHYYLYVDVSGAGKNQWKQVMYFERNQYTKRFKEYEGDAGASTADNLKPVPSSISWDNSKWNMTVPKSGTASLTTGSATVYDQYGVQWYQEPTYYNNLTSTNTNIGTGVTLNTVGPADRVTLSVTNAARDFVGRNTSYREFYIQPYMPSHNKWFSTKYVRINNVQYTVKFLNSAGSVIKTQNVIYGGSAAAPAFPGKAYDATYHYNNNGWDRGFTGVSADINVSPKYTAVKHSFGGWTVTKAPTCTAAGTQQRKCSCGYVQNGTVNALGHAWNAGTVTKAPTCKDTGIKTFTCTRCGATKTETVAKNPANHVGGTEIRNKKAPTCFAEGYTGDTYCLSCNAKLSSGKAIAKTAHNMGEWYTNNNGTHSKKCLNAGCSYAETVNCTYTDWTVTIEPTCASEGSRYRTCTVCGYKDVQAIPVNPDNHTGETYISGRVEPTCFSEGTTGDIRCKACDAVLTKGTVIPKLEHSMGAWTANNDGTHTKKCTNDGCTYKETGNCTYGDWTVTVLPTCTANGVKERKCTVCGYVDKAEVSALGHEMTEIVYKAPTCTLPGNNKYYHCTRCDIYFKDIDGKTETTVNAEVIDALGHTPAQAVIENRTEPTCTEKGSYNLVTYCEVCGEKLNTEFVEIPATGHSLTPWAENSDGTHSRYCENKDCTFGETENCTYGGWTVTLEPTCTEKGIKERICTVCGYVDKAEVPALGHTMSEIAYAAPTCTLPGNNKYYHCTRCDKYFKDIDGNIETTVEAEVLDALGHTPAEAVVENRIEPTCTKDGKYDSVVYCSVCDAELNRKTIVLDALGHTPGEAVIENRVEATCTKDGKYDSVVYCSVCNAELGRETIAIPALGHDYQYSETVAPTCVAEGYDIYVCSHDAEHIEYRNYTPIDKNAHKRAALASKAPTCNEIGYTEAVYCELCGFVIDKGKVIPALGHDIEETKAVPATCTHEGRTAGKVCRTCGAVLVKSEVLPMLSHKYTEYPGKPATCTEDGYTAGLICKGCGKIINSEPIKALGHDYTAEVHEPTCTEAGYTVYICKNDPTHTYREEGAPATGHKGGKATCVSPAICEICGEPYGEKGTHNYIAKVTAPTCTTGGYTEFTCEYCGDSYIDNKTEAAGHKYDEAVITLAPTCTANGLKTFTCTVCGGTYTEEIIAPGHKIENWVMEGGQAKGTCTVCGETVYTSPEDAGLENTGCERCGMNHIPGSPMFMYKGILCSIIHFFRQIAAFFQGIGR